MSRINVEVGTATVDIRADDFTNLRGTFAGGYNPYDLVNATIKALRAICTDDATVLADSIEEMRLSSRAAR